MAVRAKMKCVSAVSDGEGGTVELTPVTSGSPENDQFYKYTPGGQLQLSTINEAAFQQFEVDKEYYVDVTPA